MTKKKNLYFVMFIAFSSFMIGCGSGSVGVSELEKRGLRVEEEANILAAIGGARTEAAEEMEVSTWDTPECMHTMTTNHFILRRGAPMQIAIDLSGCNLDFSVLHVFGYHTQKTRSNLLTAIDGVRITVVNAVTGVMSATDSGWLTVDRADPPIYSIQFESMKQDIKVRLRASAL